MKSLFENWQNKLKNYLEFNKCFKILDWEIKFKIISSKTRF